MTDADRQLLPSRPLPDSGDASPRILDLTSEDADLLFNALSSTTARRIFTALHDKPAPPAELAENLDLSLQNVHYHLRNLRDANLIEEVETGYSEKGVEMSIYAPAAEPVVISGGEAKKRSRLRELLVRMAGLVTLFGLLSAFTHWAITREISLIGTSERPHPTPAPAPQLFAPGDIPPGLIFFIGGLVMFVLIAGWWYYQRRW